MELRHLRYFRTVAELLNFSRAAEKLRVAQPALSRQIRALEEEIGTPLLVREGGVRLTDAGQAFYERVLRILDEVDEAVRSARHAADATRGELIICNDWRVANHFLPDVVSEFRQRYPRAEVQLRDLRLADQLAVLRARKAHLGFVVRSLIGRRTDLETLLVLRARLMAILPTKHRLARQKEVALADLAEETWVPLDEKEAPGYRAFLVQLCRLSGFTPKFGPPAGTPEGVHGRVAAGYGVALALETNAPVGNRLLRVVALDVEPLEICAVWHRSEKSPLLRAMIPIVEEQARKLAAG